MPNKLFVLLLFSALALLVPSCSGVDSDSDAGVQSGRVGVKSDQPGVFAREVTLQFVDPTTGELLGVDDEMSDLTPLRAQGVQPQSTGPKIYQRVRSDYVGRTFDSFELLPGNFPTAFTPESDVNPRFGAIQVTGTSTPIESDGVPEDGFTEWTWTLPPNVEERPTLVRFPSYKGNTYTFIDHNLVVIRSSWTVLNAGSSAISTYGYDWTLTINGQVVAERHVNNFDRRELWNIQPPNPAPVFQSPYSGLYSVRRVTKEDEIDYTQVYNYRQKALVFSEEFPEVDFSSADPVEIRNTVEWDDGTPAENVTWRMDIDDEVFEGVGEIAALWTPDEREIGPVLAREDLEVVPFSVNAEANAYFDAELNRYIRYVANSGSEVPGQTKVRIVNETVSPEEPFAEPNSGVTLAADVWLVDVNIEDPEEDVEWYVDLIDPEGNLVYAGAHGVALAMGNGLEISGLLGWPGERATGRESGRL